MRIAVAALLILASSHTCAQWERTDTAMLTGALSLIVIDWGQTRDMVRRNATETVPAIGEIGKPINAAPKFHENNPLLPSNPSQSDINRAALIGLTGTAGLAYVLPQTYRRWFLGGVIVIETAVVAKNHQIGLRVSF